MGHRYDKKSFGTLITHKWSRSTQENNQLYQDYN